jgi:DNA-binding XRE family transcriptional regulator
MAKSSNILKSRTVTREKGEKYQVIRDSKGAPEYYLVPFADFHKLIERDDEDAALIAAGNAARHDEAFPAAVAERLVAGETPLKVIREWRRLTQEQLEAAAGVPAQYISQIERRAGGRNVGRKVAAKLAPALGVSAEALMEI